MKRSIKQVYDSIINRPVFMTMHQVWKYLFWSGVAVGLVIGIMIGVAIGVGI